MYQIFISKHFPHRCTDASNHGCRRIGTHDNILNPVKSARIRTLNSFAFKYGKVEINAKMPSGDWLVPSIKFLPKNNAYGSWPASGEIDLVQSRGNRELIRNGINIGTDQISSALHFGPYAKADAGQATTYARSASEKGKGFNSSFHRYQMEWSADKITFSVDDIETATIKAKSGFWDKGEFESQMPGTHNPWAGLKMAPFDQEFYLSINLAVGGNDFFPDDAANAAGEKPWANNSINAMTDFWRAKNAWLPTWKVDENRTKEASFLVDYIRVWAL